MTLLHFIEHVVVSLPWRRPLEDPQWAARCEVGGTTPPPFLETSARALSPSSCAAGLGSSHPCPPRPCLQACSINACDLW